MLVISHGWNNNTDDATELYRALVGNMARLASNGQRNHDTLQGRSLAILGIYWPSMKWTEEDLVPVANAGDMTAGLSESDLDTGLVEEKLADWATPSGQRRINGNQWRSDPARK